LGEPDKALDRLEPLLPIPYYLSPGGLRIDPTFALLRGNPRFERLVTDCDGRIWLSGSLALRDVLHGSL